MSLEATLTTCIQRVATEFQTVYAATGSLPALNTTDKSNLVAAINEVLGNIGTVQTTLNDDLAAQLLALKNEILGGATAAYDTLMELQQFIVANEDQIGTILTAIGNRVRFDQAQVLDATQQATARNNIGAVAAADVGAVDFDCVGVFEAALAA
jgi:hypothetical protein